MSKRKVIPIDKVKGLSSLKFDDEIEGSFLGGTYTHHDTDGKPLFLMKEKVNGEWQTLNFYSVGLKEFKDTVNKYDLKKSKEQQ